MFRIFRKEKDQLNEDMLRILENRNLTSEDARFYCEIISKMNESDGRVDEAIGTTAVVSVAAFACLAVLMTKFLQDVINN